MNLIKKEPKIAKEQIQSPLRSKSMVIGGIALSLISLGLLIFVISQKAVFNL
ncbi:Hypothetical protein P9211_06581 [Prochlorococcus marinus str. MIT 9211]|uniref:Uncharacterized protein n=1 Tax=Prochlorococcus marinus (strain MIT 9211) TaxID=93059 RepID=A9B9S7_PROM4|nr:Hypothetical protein P9211_06581 [Prochlorococcus marinus str. MIT 9211]